MSVSIDKPDELHDQGRSIAEAPPVAVERVFASTFADQLAAWQRLHEMAACGDREKFLAVLDQVSDVEPEEYDRL